MSMNILVTLSRSPRPISIESPPEAPRILWKAPWPDYERRERASSRARRGRRSPHA